MQTTKFPKLLRIDGSKIASGKSNFDFPATGVLLCSQGTLDLEVNDSTLRVQSGDMFIISPYNTIKVEKIYPDFQSIICDIDMEFAVAAIKTVEWSSGFYLLTRNPLVTPLKEDMERIHDIIRQIEQRRDDSRRLLTTLIIAGLWKILTYQILEAYTSVHTPDKGFKNSKDTIMLTFQADLMRDCAVHRDVSHYAALQKLTPRYFSTVIKEVSNMTPLNWIVLSVVSEAKKLMIETRLSVKEISYKLNFASPSFFSRWFKQYTGETPSEYRSRIRTLA